MPSAHAWCMLTVTLGVWSILVASILLSQGATLQLQSCRSCAHQQCMPHWACPQAALVRDGWDAFVRGMFLCQI